VATFTLTTGVDTFVGGPGANTVYGTAATLNAGDSLTGGPGTNVLQLIRQQLRSQPARELHRAIRRAVCPCPLNAKHGEEKRLSLNLNRRTRK
jgi:hypothetical protein